MKDRDPAGLENALDRRRQKSTIRRLTTKPANSVDFSSNDFLSLASSSVLRQAFLEELQVDPSRWSLGSTGSRLLDGNSAYAEALEDEIASFHRSPTALLCNSGYEANAGLFSCLPQPGDLIVYDELIHASVHDGMKGSRSGRYLPFEHNNVQSLGRILRESSANDAALRDGQRNVFVAVEAVYSMAGDVAPLREMVEMVEKTLVRGNGHIIVDEAHSTGVFGSQGRGLVCQLELEHKISVRLHTFGKALACGGAVILCSPLIKQYLINYARPLIYTTFMSHPSLVAIRAAYHLLRQNTTEALVQQLRTLIDFLHERLHELQTSLQLPHPLRHLLRVPDERPHSAISYVMSSKPHQLAAYCQSKGFLVRGIVAPTVPAGTERVRICLHAGNTVAQVTMLVELIRVWAQREARELLEGQVQAKF